MMTCNILVLFSNDAETVAMELVSRFDNAAINTICVNNVAHSQRLSCIRQGTKAKIHVIFFSPEFLKFLEDSPLDAYYLCGQLDTNSTLAVFCLGLQERDVFCYHMAPLKSFSSWSKFEVKDSPSNGCIFPQELLKRIQEVIVEDVHVVQDIVVVPQFLKKHNRLIYVIFSSLIEELKDITVHLSDQREIDIQLEKMNPYVLKFSVPDSLFLFSHNVTVRVESKGHIITKQMIHLSQDAPKQTEGKGATNRSHPSTQEELYLDEQLKFLTNFSGLNPDKEDTITTAQPEDTLLKPEKAEAIDKQDYKDLRELCKQYGLEELSLLISDPPLLSKEYTLRESGPRLRKLSDQDIKLRRDSLRMCLLPEMDSSHRMNSFLVEKSDHPRLFAISRSLSLPSTLLPTSDDRDSCGMYLDMGGTEPAELKPHEKLLMNMKCPVLKSQQSNGSDHYHKEILHSLSSEQYVSLLLTGEEGTDIRALLKKGLSDSQQELLDLMQNFKEGECTISNVEKQFQLWRQKHCTSHGQAKRRKTSAFALPWRKKKETKGKERIKQAAVINDPKAKEEQASVRKISNTSGSSASSKASEKSNLTMSSKGEEKTCNESKGDDLAVTSTGWVSTYSPPSNRNCCPLYPEINPPPLPSRPPPSPKISQIMKPVPLPRKKLPEDAKRETVQTKTIEEEKNLELTSSTLNLGEPTEDEEANVSIVDLCQKYGLETLGECFISGGCPFQEQMLDDKRNQDEVFGTQDMDGYEMPIKPNLKSRDETGAGGSIRRSFSLPSDLSQSFEFPEDAVLDRSDNILEKKKDPCSCDHCNSIDDNFTSNIYMSLLEFRRDSGVEGKQGLSKEGLSKSQQELMDLMYAFKRGDKTISQVEQQFQEWHSRHMGKCPANFVLGNTMPDKCKTRKQSAFGLPGLKNLILGKPRKKSSLESKHSEFETEVLRIKKNSEASNSSAKRLSKLSYTSTSSANSELNEVFRAAKDSGKNSEISSDGTPPAYPKRPPPLPPNRPLPSHEIAKRNELSQALKSPEIKNDQSTKDPEKKQKPIPPPKPKLLFKSQTVDSPPCGEGIHKTEEPKPDSEENAVVRPSSPDYIVPNMHLTLRAGQKKSSDAKLKKMIEKFDKNHKKGRKGSESGIGSRIELSSPTVFANKNAKGINSPPPEESLLELPPQTLELLKKANLLSFPEEKSMFYVRRTRSYPNLRISQLQKQPIYLQLI